MRDPLETAEGGAAMATRLGPIKARVRTAFDTMSETTTTVPRMERALATRLRAPLGKLISAGQLRDTFDQRIAHLEEASARVDRAEPEVRAATFHVVSLQLVALSRLLEETAQIAAAAFRSVLDQGEQPPEDLAEEIAGKLRDLGHRGLAAAAALSAAAEILGSEADGHAARVERTIPGDRLAAADLDWMLALYTMDDERRVHRTAIAQAAAGLS